MVIFDTYGTYATLYSYRDTTVTHHVTMLLAVFSVSIPHVYTPFENILQERCTILVSHEKLEFYLHILNSTETN